MEKRNPGLSREYVIKSILQCLDAAAAEKRWGSIMVAYQAGVVRVIEEKKTTVKEDGHEC
jgi:hypothetical protein